MLGRSTIQYEEASLDEALLQRIASQTGGLYFNVRDAGGLTEALYDIDAMETTSVVVETRQRSAELCHWLVGAALWLTLAGVSINLWLKGVPV